MAVRKSASITAEEALKQNVVDLICRSTNELLQKIDGRQVELPARKVTLNTKNAEKRTRQMTWRQKILNAIINPNIAYILMILGFYGLLFEITHPGIGVPGVAGALCLIIAAYAFQLLPVNYAGLLLILLAIVLFIAEVKVQSYGLLSLGGLVAMTIGSLMLVRAPEPFIGVSIGIILPVVAATAVIVIFLVTLVIRAHSKKTTTGREGLVGDVGTVEVALTPEGKVFIQGELWTAFSDVNIETGKKVRIKEVQGMRVYVEPIE
jgi:membrane-bound serine protease (ClpP class)